MSPAAGYFGGRNETTKLTVLALRKGTVSTGI
jgi:hypothetical protein